MVNLNRLSKKELGKILIPTKIYTLKYQEELAKVYQKLFFNNINFIVITNLFFLSILFSILAYVLSYPYLYPYFQTYLDSGLLWKSVVVFSTYYIYNLFFYYVLILGYFFYYDSKFKKNEHEIEKGLPEFIDNLVSNIKGGIPIEKALLKSVRKEQKALLKEITLINEKIMMGKSISFALKEFRERFDSPVINRTFFLIVEGIKGGGNLAAPLERISQNLKRLYSLEEEIKANSGGFTVVIRMITLVVAPLLFALAITLLTFIGSLFNLIASGSEAGFSFVQAIPIEFTSYLLVFSYAMLSLITFFSSLITSQLKGEKTYTALKYLPVSLGITLVLFNFFSNILLNYFGTVIQ